MKNTFRGRRTDILALLVLLTIGLITPQAQRADEIIQFETIKKEQSSAYSERRNFLITNRKEWRKLWKIINGHAIDFQPLPEIDFENKMIIAVFQGYQAPVANISIIKVVKSESSLTVQIKEKVLGSYLTPPCPPMPAYVTTPYHIIQIDRIGKPFRNNLEFDIEVEFYNCP